MKNAVAEKILVLGVDAMDPRLTRKLLNKGLLPNTQKLLDAGSAREDLVMLGGHPTVTPPMWTTLATGAYPITHGIMAYYRMSPKGLDYEEYNLDSRLCQAEQLWNVFAEAGKKTLVFHWPGSSWPPSSDSPLLHVVDGTQPAAVNMGVAHIEGDIVVFANTQTTTATFKEKAASDSANVPCVETELKTVDVAIDTTKTIGTEPQRRIVMQPKDRQGMMSDMPFDVALSPIKEPANWDNITVPAKAKEFVILFAHGAVRRVGLLLQNDNGEYDRVAIYKNKHAVAPLYTLMKDVLQTNLIDESIKGEEKYIVNRSARLLEISENGDSIKIWFSAAFDINNDELWSPKSLYKTVTETAGYPPCETMLGGRDYAFLTKCMFPQWDVVGDWQSKAIHTLIEKEKYNVVFSHFHSIDGCGHMIMKYLKNGTPQMSPAVYEELITETYAIADRYIGHFLHLLDEGWAIFLVSDHGQVCPEYEPPYLLDGTSINVMEELGFTVMKKDENGKNLYEIDWEKTKAVNTDAFININLKGRDPYGIVDPADKYELEEEIITALYGYRDKNTGKRVVALAVHNKDAIQFGMGGPRCGDIVLFLAEGYNYDHADGLSTTYGYGDTSQSPICIMAGPGIKKGYRTTRIIREVDITPTIAVLGGVRPPAQCEGAPIYQILEKDISL